MYTNCWTGRKIKQDEWQKKLKDLKKRKKFKLLYLNQETKLNGVIFKTRVVCGFLCKTQTCGDVCWAVCIEYSFDFPSGDSSLGGTESLLTLPDAARTSLAVLFRQCSCPTPSSPDPAIFISLDFSSLVLPSLEEKKIEKNRRICTRSSFVMLNINGSLQNSLLVHVL